MDGSISVYSKQWVGKKLMTENIPSPLDDEIDLREILKTLWNSRVVILCAILIPTLITFVVSFWFLPRAYQATAYVLIGKPIINLDDTNSSSTNSTSTNSSSATYFTISPILPDIKAVAELAEAPALLESVANDPEVLTAAKNYKVSTINSAVAVAIGNDQIRLQVTDTIPERAALLTNVWAEKVALTVNASYGVDIIAENLDAQVLQSENDYKQAQATLEDALSKSPVDALRSHLQLKQTDLQCLLNNTSRLNRVLDDLQTFEQELDGLSEGLLPIQHGLTLLMLRQHSLTSLPCQITVQTQPTSASESEIVLPNISMPSSPEFTLQIDSSSIGSLTVSEALASTDQMRTALQSQIARLQSQQGNLEQEIPRLRADLENEESQLTLLTVKRDRSQTLYAALSEQQQLVKTVMMESSKVASVSMYAVTPQDEISPKAIVNSMVTGILGLVLSASFVLAVDWWRKE